MSTSTIFRASRPIFRASTAQFTSTTQRTTFRHNAFKSNKRWQSTAAPSEESWFKKFWNSPVGLKTVHFWAPVMKWALVLAGVSDFARPAEKLSLTQNAALTATGIIWTRWCLIIKPKNYLLAAVNFFLGMVGVVQVSRIVMWQQAQKKLEAEAAAAGGIAKVEEVPVKA